MEPVIRLRQLHLTDPVTRGDGQVLSGTLSVSTPGGTQLLPVRDVVHLLVQLLGTQEYQDDRVRVATGRDDQDRVDLHAGCGPDHSFHVRVPYQYWYQTVSELIVATSTALASLGAGALVEPLMQAMTPPDGWDTGLTDFDVPPGCR